MVNDYAWETLLLKLLRLNEILTTANIDIYQWHRLDPEGKHGVDWLLEITGHPGIEDVQKLKLAIIADLIQIINDDKVAASSSFKINTASYLYSERNYQIPGV